MLRSLFGRSGPRPASVATVAPAAALDAHADEPIDCTPFGAGPGAAVAAPPDGDHWQMVLSSELSRWRVLAMEMPGTPDAAALVDALEEPAESVIRQLPSSARDAVGLLENTSISRSQLAAKLGKDPALVQGLLRTANSAAYASGRKSVLSLDSAIERIGLVAARAVVMANCVEGLLSRPGGSYDAMLSDVWAHMVRTAPIARLVAPAFRVDRDEAFSVALLHDVGKLVIFDQISTLRAQLRRPVVVPIAWLSALTQEVHAPLGALAALRWSMGARAAIAIGDHHRVDPAMGVSEFAEVIFAAERMDHVGRKGELLDLDGIWKRGRLSGSMERTQSSLEALAGAA